MKTLYKLLLTCVGFFIISSTDAQLKINNSRGISFAEWQNYINKTNVFLESVDEASFINYVIISGGGHWNEKPYFVSYIKSQIKKDREELVYKVGTGVIKNVAEVNKYMASLQPNYSKLYAEFKPRMKEIVEAENQKNALKLKAATGPLPTTFGCGSPCSNPGFEAGTGFWDYWSGTACSTSPDPCSLVSGFSSSAHVLETVGGFDPIVGAALPLVAPGGGGTNSLMIGNGTGTNYGASRASISFTVDSNSTNFTYRYAVVLQDPGSTHTDPERPYFKVKLRDALGNVLACGDYEVLAKPPIVDFFLAPGFSDVYYRPWTTVFVPLSAYIGQCVTLEFTSSDCAQGGHYGYAYIDADCSPSTLVTSSPAVCGGATVALTAPSGAASYSWTNTSTGGTTGIVGSATGSSIVVDTGSTFQVVMTSVTGVACTSTLTITVLQSPFSFFTNFTADTVCAGTPTTFDELSLPVDSATAWSWDFDNDGLTDSNLEDPTHIFADGGTYPVTLISTWGPCNADTTINVSVLPGGIPVITPVATMCATASATTLVVTGASGGVWAGPGITNTTTGAFDPALASTTGPNVITYSTPGMCGAADTISITVIPSSSPAWTPSGVCEDVAPINLNALITGTTGGTWSGTGVTGSTFDPSGLSGSIAITYTVGTSPCVMTSTQNIVVTPVANATISGTSVCSDDAPFAIVGADPGGVWSGSGVNPTTGIFNPASVAAPGTYIITYTIAGVCSAVDTALITVIPGGNPAWSIQPNICEQAASIDLNTLISVGGTAGGTWSGPGVTGSTFDPTGLSGNVNIVYTVGQGGCANSTTLVIDVDPIDAAFTATPTSGDEPLFVNFVNGSSNAVSYLWDLGDGTNSSTTNPSNTYMYGDYTVMLIATNASGCQDTAWLLIEVDQISLLTVPNVFTPNGDGENELFHAITQYGLTDFDATIYDRWGLKMYEWSDANAGWNGQAKNGSPAPDGTYYYIINATGTDKKDYLYTGFVQLIREK